MKELTTRERMKRAYAHKESDRVPMIDVPWSSTLARWQRDGMPREADFLEYFGLDLISKFDVDNSPRYPVRVAEENQRFVMKTTPWGGMVKELKDTVSSLEFVSYSVSNWDSWQKMKERMTPDRDRIPWDFLKTNYPNWRKKGYWIRGRLTFGFDITKTFITGDLFSLISLLEDPELLMDMYNHELDICLALMDQVWEAGYTFDEISWDDDVAYKQTQFFSKSTYRDILKPFHKRAIDWAHRKGIRAHMHSCGDITPFISEFLDIGLDGLNPLEVKAGVDPISAKKSYGDHILLRGGFDPYDWREFETAEAQLRERLPVMMKGGGYLFSSDHSIPDFVDLKTYQRIVALAKETGVYQ